MFCFQELLVIHFLIIVVIPLPPKIRIMTSGAVTVLCPSKEPGGTRAVITPTWTVCIITDNTRQGLMVSTGITGKDITTPPRELRWKSDQWSFKNSPYWSSLFTCWSDANKSLKKKCLLSDRDWVIKISENEFGYHLLLLFSHPSFSTLNFFVCFVLFSFSFALLVLSRYLVLFGLKIML